MDDVHVRAEQLGEGAEMVDAIRLDDGRTRWSMPLGARLAGCQQRFLERVDRVRILAMGGHDDAEVFGQSHRSKQVFIRQVQRTLVCEENLERGDPSLHDLAKLVADMLLEADDGHVERVIHRRQTLGLGLPELERRHRLVRLSGADHLDQRRRTAGQRCLARRRVVIDSVGAHERQIDVHVRVDESRKHVFAARVDDFGSGSDELRIDVWLDPRDRLVLGVDIAREVFRGRDDPAAARTLGDHLPERPLGAQEGAGQIGLHGRRPLLERVVLHR